MVEKALGKPISTMTYGDINMKNAEALSGINEGEGEPKYRKLLNKLSGWLTGLGSISALVGVSDPTGSGGAALGGLAALAIAFALHNKELGYKEKYGELNEMRFDGKKPIEFTDETVALEEENLEEDTKYKIKLDAPKSEPAFDDSGNGGLDSFEDVTGDDAGGFGDEAKGESEGDKPFDDEPFDAGVEASEEEDPEKYIQQLAGKIGTSMRKYNDERGEPDFDLEKYAINSVISASHTSEMDEEDQDDIIRKVKTSGAADDSSDADKEVSAEPEVEPEVDAEPTSDTEDMFGGDEGGLEEDATFSQFDFENETLKRLSELQESKKNDIFVENTDMKDTIKVGLDEMVEPAIKPPVVKPGEKPSRRTKRIWEPKPIAKPKPKMAK